MGGSLTEISEGGSRMYFQDMQASTAGGTKLSIDQDSSGKLRLSVSVPDLGTVRIEYEPKDLVDMRTGDPYDQDSYDPKKQYMAFITGSNLCLKGADRPPGDTSLRPNCWVIECCTIRITEMQ